MCTYRIDTLSYDDERTAVRAPGQFGSVWCPRSDTAGHISQAHTPVYHFYPPKAHESEHRTWRSWDPRMGSVPCRRRDRYDQTVGTSGKGHEVGRPALSRAWTPTVTSCGNQKAIHVPMKSYRIYVRSAFQAHVLRLGLRYTMNRPPHWLTGL